MFSEDLYCGHVKNKVLFAKGIKYWLTWEQAQSVSVNGLQKEHHNLMTDNNLRTNRHGTFGDSQRASNKQFFLFQQSCQIMSIPGIWEGWVVQKCVDHFIIEHCINPLPYMPILGSSNSAPNRDMMSKIWTNGDTIIWLCRKRTDGILLSD